MLTTSLVVPSPRASSSLTEMRAMHRGNPCPARLRPTPSPTATALVNHCELCGHSQRGLRWQGSSIGHRRFAFWVQTRTILAAAPNAGSGERACGRCNGPSTLVWEHLDRRALPIARSLRAAGLHASARRTEIRHGTARLTIAVMWPRCLHDVSPSLCRSASSRAPSEGSVISSGSNGMTWSV